MKRLITYLLPVVAAAALAGCASPTYYQASGADKRIWGYAEKQVDGALFRVSYMDMYSVGVERTYAYAMYRTAELAAAKGATHFEVLEGLVNRDMLERFIARPLEKQTSLHYDPRQVHIVNDVTGEVLADAGLTLPPNALPMRPVRTTYTQTYIYVPVQPPPPPQQVSLLVRLLNAPSLEASKGFDVQDLLARLGPKIVRAPLKPV